MLHLQQIINCDIYKSLITKEKDYNMRIFNQIKWLPILVFLQIFGTDFVNAQCNLSDLTLEVSDCDETDFVDMTVNFNFTGQGSQGFTIIGNGTNYGNFEYSALPVTLFGLEGNCETEYEFIIRDTQDPTCSVFAEYGTICCDQFCELTIDSLMTSECLEDTYSISLYASTNSAIENITVSINGLILLETPYTLNPIIIEDLPSDLIGNNVITICNSVDSDCCASYTFLNPCECTISNVTADIIDCELVDSSYYAIFDFDHAATNDSFQMGYSEGGNNNFLGVFAYADLPITAGPIFMSDNEREILIVDTDNFFCFAPAFLGVVNDCNIECQIFNLFAESYQCEEGQYYIDFEFETEDIEGSTFEVIVDDVNYGSYTYGENFYSVGPINQNCDDPPLLVIEDSNITFCKDFFNFDEPICCGVLCEFNEFSATAECNDTEEVIITFQYENFATNENSQLFVVFQNEEFGPFIGPSGAESITIPLLADGTYSLDIFVGGNEACSANTSFVISCPEVNCSISNLLAEAQECIDGSFFVNIQFDAEDVSETFEILGNGQNYGTFTYGETFYTVGPIDGDCETIYEFVIIDQEDPSCMGVFEFTEPICCSTCEYIEASVALIDCIEDVYTITIELEYQDAEEGFLVYFLDDTIVATYNQLPLEITNLPIGVEIEITITSANDEECTITTTSFLESCFDSIDDLIFSEITIFQNQTYLSLSNSSNESYQYLITSTSGQSLTKGFIKSKTTKEISTQNLNNGIYFITLMNEGRLETKKIVIVK